MTEMDWNAKLYAERHGFVWKHGSSLRELLAPQPGERILDLGCGNGKLTAEIAAAGAQVVGIDSSDAMLDMARRDFPSIEFIRGDARDFSFAEKFDAVFSNAVLHWVKEAEQAATCIANCLKQGRRFVAEFGGKGNISRIQKTLIQARTEMAADEVDSPWYFPGIVEYAGILEKAGLEVETAWLFDRFTELEGAEGLRNWIKMFGGAYLQGINEDRQQELFSRVEEGLRDSLYCDGKWWADYRRLRVLARKSGGSPH